MFLLKGIICVILGILYYDPIMFYIAALKTKSGSEIDDLVEFSKRNSIENKVIKIIVGILRLPVFIAFIIPLILHMTKIVIKEED